MGGSQYQIKCLLDELLPLDRFDITYIANRTAHQPQANRYPIISIGGKVPRFGYLMHSLPLYRALLDARPDVIYQRVACGYTGVAALYARQHGAKLVWHVSHDSDVTPDSSLHGRNPLRRFLEKRSVEYGLRKAHHIVTQTKHQATLLQRNYGRIADAIIPNFHPQPSEKIDKSGPLSVLWVANFKPWKQPDAFVRLASALRDLKNVRFTMIGALPTAPRERQWSDSILSQIERMPNLSYLGRKRQSEINELMARAHIFVNTSKHEGFPNTFIQAWMREVPVVSMHVDPDGVLNRERVGVHEESEEKLCMALRLLLTDHVVRHEYAARAKAYAFREHSLRNVHLLARIIGNDNIATGDIDSAGVNQHT